MMKEPQSQPKDLSFNFFIRTVTVEDELTDDVLTYDKIYIKVQHDGKELNYTVMDSDVQFKTILNEVKKLYELSRSSNENILKGVREEIVKLVALILWNFYR